MGDFRIELQAVGGHGCDRATKSGEFVKHCGGASCPDCDAREFVEKMRQKYSLKEAVFTHWPGQASQVVDVFDVYGAKQNEPLKVKRRGDFFG
jgi:hypothetical protein